jgi:hypothetical protein
VTRSITSTCTGFIRLLFLLAFSILISSTAKAQTSSTNGSTPSGLTRGAPIGSYSLSGFDNVNLYNGNLNFRLPLLAVGGRGSAQMAMTLTVNSKRWRVERESDQWSTTFIPEPDWWTSFEVGYGPGILQRRTSNITTRQCRWNVYPFDYYKVSQYTYTTLTFIKPEGTEYELRDRNNLGKPLTSTACNTNQGPSRGTVFLSVDGSGATFISDTTIYDNLYLPDQPSAAPGGSGYLLLRDGTRYRIDDGSVAWMRDRNGNKLSFAHDANKRVTSITDSLNRQVTVAYDVNEGGVYGVCDKITFKGSGGQQRFIRVTKTNMGSALRSGYSLQSPHDLFPGLSGSGTSYDPTVVSKVWLPNSDGTGPHYQYYQLAYNSYGELARVELPIGGAVEYDTTMLPLADTGLEIYRRVSERRVYADGATLEGKTTYSATQSASTDAWPWTTTVTVDQLNVSSTLLTRSKHYFNGSGLATLGFYANAVNKWAIFPAWNEGEEYQTEELAADGTTVLRRVNNTSEQRAAVPWWSAWASAHSLNSAREPAYDLRLTQVVNTLVDSNQVSQETFSYDQYNNQTDVYQYDFGAGAPGALVRRSHTDYLTTNPVNNVDYTSTAIYQRSLPTQTSVYDAAGVARTRSTFEYDNYLTDSNHAPLWDRASISGLDSSFSVSYTTRGNPTATTRYLLVNGSATGSFSAYVQFDIAGNIVKAIDPLGYATTFDFTDRFGAADGDARANASPTELSSVGQYSYALATKVTNALGHTAYAQFDYYTGRPVDGEDANGVVSSGYYGDSLDRPTQVIRSANQGTTVKSQIGFSYDDANRVITTTSDLMSFNDNALSGKVFYDGLGRTTESRQYEGGSNYIVSKQNYDALGRAYQSSNPYRPWQSETAVWTNQRL